MSPGHGTRQVRLRDGPSESGRLAATAAANCTVRRGPPNQTFLGGPSSEYLLQKQRNGVADLNERICTRRNAVTAKQEELPTAVDNRNNIT